MSSLAFASVQDWQYHDIAARAREAADRAAKAALPLQPAGLSEAQVAARVQSALAEAQQLWTAQAEAKTMERARQMEAALDAFAGERAAYFRRVEGEVVTLALAIARKVLEREAQLDPTLLSGLVRIALDRMGAGSAVRLRVPPEEVHAWGQQAAWKDARYTCELVPDETLLAGDCVAETDLGSAHFGFDAQLKEIEVGLRSILAQRPVDVPTQQPERP